MIKGNTHMHSWCYYYFTLICFSLVGNEDVETNNPLSSSASLTISASSEELEESLDSSK